MLENNTKINLDLSSDYSVYNEKEIEYLDKYQSLVKNAFDVNIFFKFIGRRIILYYYGF